VRNCTRAHAGRKFSLKLGVGGGKNKHYRTRR
jgi:hypothetical protein